MKSKILISALFLALFIIVSAGIIYLNSVYENIFKFTFSPRSYDPLPVTISEVNVQHQTEIPVPEHDTLDSDINLAENHFGEDPQNRKDSLMFTSLLDSLINLKSIIEEQNVSHFINEQSGYINTNSKTSINDSTYQVWLKTTADLYASMDARKAAKIIQNFSDNIARDIIYAMRKKNAAKILAEMNPELANRITNFSQ